MLGLGRIPGSGDFLYPLETVPRYRLPAWRFPDVTSTVWIGQHVYMISPANYL